MIFQTMAIQRHDVLTGAMRNKVFATGNFLDKVFSLDMFPDEFFAPLAAGREKIAAADYVILSVGGNNVREFLMSVRQVSGREAKQEFIERRFPQVLEDLKGQYLMIVENILAINPRAKLILMTQYYPSFVQNTYGIYEFMAMLSSFIGKQNASPADIIHELMIRTYRELLNAVMEKYRANVIVADVTSSLNPFDVNNHVCQIEPSGAGGKVIANLLKHIISRGDEAIGRSYSSNEDAYEQTEIHHWTPRHPDNFRKIDNQPAASWLSHCTIC